MWCAAWRVVAIPGPRSISIFTRGLATVAAIMALAAYGVSWGFFLRTGQFANVEVMQFAVGNRGQLLDYFRHAEPTHIWAFGVVVSAAVTFPVLLVAAMRRLPGSRTPLPIRWGAGQRLAWWLATIVLWAALFQVVVDPVGQRRGASTDLLVRRLNPLVTLAASGAESLFSEAIRPVLQNEELTPIARAGPQAGQAALRERPSIVFIAVESLRYDVIHQQRQGREVTPTLNGLAKRGLNFTRAYAESTHRTIQTSAHIRLFIRYGRGGTTFTRQAIPGQGL